MGLSLLAIFLEDEKICENWNSAFSIYSNFFFQDVNSVKVSDSGFENVATAEFVRVSNCQNENGATSCSQSELFKNNSVSGESKTKSKVVQLFLNIFHCSCGFNYSYAYCGHLSTYRCHYCWNWNRTLYSSVEKKE